MKKFKKIDDISLYSAAGGMNVTSDDLYSSYCFKCNQPKQIVFYLPISHTFGVICPTCHDSYMSPGYLNAFSTRSAPATPNISETVSVSSALRPLPPYNGSQY